MSVFSYIARRSVIPAHADGALYSIEIPMREMSPQNKTHTQESISISGITQNSVHRRDSVWVLKTGYFHESSNEYRQVVEFVESVDEREIFSVDLHGTLAVPGVFRSAVLTGNVAIMRREQSGEFMFSFSVRLSP